jgi:hypothetical protein
VPVALLGIRFPKASYSLEAERVWRNAYWLGFVVGRSEARDWERILEAGGIRHQECRAPVLPGEALLARTLRLSFLVTAKIENYARWFNTDRPHVGLNHRSPEDMATGVKLQARKITSGRFEVRFLNGDCKLPIFPLRDAV